MDTSDKWGSSGLHTWPLALSVICERFAKRGKAKLFADDTKAYRETSNKEECEVLQTDLNRFSAWSKHWLINFTALKCVVLRIKEAINMIHIYTGRCATRKCSGSKRLC